MSTAYRSARAETDLTEIWISIPGNDPSAADRLLDRIDQVCALLALIPTRGSDAMTSQRVCASTR